METGSPEKAAAALTVEKASEIKPDTTTKATAETVAPKIDVAAVKEVEATKLAEVRGGITGFLEDAGVVAAEKDEKKTSSKDGAWKKVGKATMLTGAGVTIAGVWSFKKLWRVTDLVLHKIEDWGYKKSGKLSPFLKWVFKPEEPKPIFDKGEKKEKK